MEVILVPKLVLPCQELEFKRDSNCECNKRAVKQSVFSVISREGLLE